MEWLQSITYTIDRDWVKQDPEIIKHTQALNMPMDIMLQIIDAMNKKLIAVNMAPYSYDKATVLQQALGNKHMSVGRWELFRAEQERLFPLPLGYDTDPKYIALLSQRDTELGEIEITLNDLSNDCRFVDGWKGLTHTHRNEHKRHCGTCKRHRELNSKLRTRSSYYSTNLQAYRDHYANVNNTRNNIMDTLARRIHEVPFTKNLHLSEVFDENITFVRGDKQITLKQLYDQLQ